MHFFKNLTTKQRIILSVLALLLIVDVVLLAQKYLTNASPVALAFSHEATSSRLAALNANARAKVIKSGYAYYKFTDRQQEVFNSFFNKNDGASLVLHVRKENAKSLERAFMYGFLFSDDFFANGKLRREIEKRPLISADLQNFDEVQLAFAVEKDSALPCGFFIYTAAPVSIKACTVRDACIGFDKRDSVPLFAFAPNGGRVNSAAPAVDFSGASLSFPTQNTRAAVMPRITVAFQDSQHYGTVQNQLTTEVNAGGEKLTIFRVSDVHEYLIQASALSNPFSLFEASDAVLLLMTKNEQLHDEAARIFTPLVADPGLIIKWPQKNWRTADYELFTWDRFPSVLLIDTRNYSVQDDFFKRLAFFVEKAGYHGTLVSDEELRAKHGFNAHDYRAESLASFFTKAEAENFLLNERECLLRDLLLANGIIVKNENGYGEGKGAVISISRESNEWLRRRLLAHECWHGIFFTDEKFRNATAAAYYTIDERSRNFLTGYWRSQPTLNYNLNDEYLVHNEFMAYIMQQSVSEVAQYYVARTGWASVQNAMPELSEYVRTTRGTTFEDIANVFNEYAFDNWGLACGRTWLIR